MKKWGLETCKACATTTNFLGILLPPSVVQSPTSIVAAFIFFVANFFVVGGKIVHVFVYIYQFSHALIY